MLNLSEISNTIEELEQGQTTFDTCIKLSALYNVREHLQKRSNGQSEQPQDKVEQELSDILPHYKRYIEVKRDFQLHKVDEETVMEYLSTVCAEINEFLCTMFYSTDSTSGRFLLYNSITDFLTHLPPF